MPGADALRLDRLYEAVLELVGKTSAIETRQIAIQERQEKIDEKIDEVRELARKTNGRVNRHDDEIAALQSAATPKESSQWWRNPWVLASACSLATSALYMMALNPKVADGIVSIINALKGK